MLRLILFVFIFSFSTISFADTLKTQKYLNSLGYNAGAADGIWGGKTENAVKQFLLDLGKSWDGKFDGEFKLIQQAYLKKFPQPKIPKLIKEVVDEPPQFNPKHKVKRGTFTDKFDIVENHKIGSYGLAVNPTGENSEFVEKFYIDGATCSGEDCAYGSVRSQLGEDIGEGKRKKESWYSFEIFLPSDFPYKSDYKRFVMFAEFKEILGCATTHFASHTNEKGGGKLTFSHMYIRDDRLKDLEKNEASFERCSFRFQKNIASLKDMRGRWTRFEYFINWTTTDAGKITIFRDGQKVVDYSGPTCSTEERCLKQNGHYYGLYSPNNKIKGGLKSVEPMTAFYRNVSRAPTREKLLGH